MNAGQHDLAVQLYSQCILEMPEEAVLYSERGVNYIHLKNAEKCLADLNKSIELRPEYAYGYAARGHAKDFFGDIDGAIADYQKAIELDPKDDINHNNLGVLLEKKGYQEAAQKHYDRSDKLRKAEKALDELVDQVEQVELESNPISEEQTSDDTTVKPSDSEGNPPEENSKNVLTEFNKMFTSSAQRKEFFDFIKNGFKISRKP